MLRSRPRSLAVARGWTLALLVLVALACKGERSGAARLVGGRDAGSAGHGAGPDGAQAGASGASDAGPDGTTLEVFDAGLRCSHAQVTPSQESACGAPVAPSTCELRARTHAAPVARELRALDLDADGRLDLIALAQTDGFARLSGPSGALDGCTRLLGLSEEAEGARAESFGDLDGDGDLDLVRLGCADARCRLVDRLELYENAGEGTLERLEDFMHATDSELRAPIAIDFDADGASEIAVQAIEQGDVSLLVLDFDEARLKVRVVQQADVRGSTPYALDMDADGDLDVAWLVHDPSAPEREPLRIDVTVNQDGRFGRVASTTYGDFFLSAPRAVVEDLDEDGRSDLVLHVGSTRSAELPKELLVLRSAPNARFERAGRQPVALSGFTYAGRDPSCEGHVLVGYGSGGLDFIRIDAQLALAPLGSLELGSPVTDLIAGDFDGDGRNELAAANEQGFVVYSPRKCTR